MSESMFPFAGPDEPAPVETAEESGGRKPVLLVGGLVGALVLAGGGFFLLTGGDSADEDVAAPVARAPQAEQPVEAVPEAVLVPVEATSPVGRNPFKALYVASPASASGTTTDGSSVLDPGSTSPTSTSAGGSTLTLTGGGTAPSGTTGTSTAPAPAGTQTQTPASVTSKRISLLAVEPSGGASFQVVESRDGAAGEPAVVNVLPGDTFATWFRFIRHTTATAADQTPRACADLLVGDALITVCQNEDYTVG